MAENLDHINFDFRESDESGCDSGPRQRDCYSCHKNYWISARVNFEIDLLKIYDQKPKEKI